MPSIKELNACSRNTYTRNDIVHMEVMILHALEWRTDELTPLHFVDHFLALRCVDLNDTVDDIPLFESTKIDKIPRRLRQFAEFFVRLVLEGKIFADPRCITVFDVSTASNRSQILPVSSLYHWCSRNSHFSLCTLPTTHLANIVGERDWIQ